MSRKIVNPSENRLRMELMYLNQGATGNWAPGSRESGFFSSVARSFRTQGGTVMDHWKGFGDVLRSEEATVDVPTFQEMAGDRDLPAPSEPLTMGQAQRRIEKFDREQRNQQFESNVRSAIGAFLGGTAPWLVSPEGLIGFAVPPLRARTVAKSAERGGRTSASRPDSAVETAVDQMGTQSSTATPRQVGGAREGMVAEAPASIMVGGTNLLAQQASYGEVDSLEASLAFGAPLVFGAGIGAIRGRRAAAQARARDTGVERPPRSADTSPDEVEVPSGLQKELTDTLGLTPEDTPKTFFRKLDEALRANNISDDVADNLREAFARSGITRRENLTPGIRRALKDVDAAERIKPGGTPQALNARIGELDKKIKNAEARVRRANKKLAETTEPATNASVRQQSRKLKKENRILTRLREERNGISGTTRRSATQDQLLKDVERRVETNARVRAQRETVEQERQAVEAARRAVDEAPDEASARAAQDSFARAQDRLDAENLRLEEITNSTSARLRRRIGVEDAPDPMRRRENLRTALKNLADEVAQTDQPLPAEFVAEFLELYQGRRPISPEAVRPVRTRDANDYARPTRDIEETVDTDPGLRALRGREGYDEAVDIQTRHERILEDCPV